MGAIWNFISGKSTDWDEFDRQQAAKAEQYRAYSEAHPRERRIKYHAYCRICGNNDCGMNPYDTPEKAIKHLQDNSSGCGRNNHSPQIQEV